MPLHRLQIAFWALLILALVGTARAGEGDGTRAVRKANQTLSQLLKKKVAAGSKAEGQLAAKVTRSLRGFLDIDELGERALVNHWSKLGAAQKTEYLSLLRDLIEKNYVKGLRANLDYTVRYTGEESKGEHLLVNTEIDTKRRGRPFTISIDYLLRKQEGGWRTFDVITDGVGLVENYRAQFNKIIGKHGFDGLLDRMRKKLATL